MSDIPYGRQDINQADIDAVCDVLRSDFLTQGPLVPSFEKAVSLYCGAEFAVAVNSATSALHIACLALGIGDGDIVWTSPITFVASANCALYCGAKIDFVDIDIDTYNISIDKLEQKLALAEKKGKLPSVLIPVHLCGHACDMEKIFSLSQKYGFKIIEDASHAIGGKYNNEPIGNCRYSHITVFSFHPVKIITTGEGGMAVTNDITLAKRLKLFRSHGITSAVEDMQSRPLDEIWNYQQVELGFNYRMTDIQAALGISQLNRLDDFILKRNQLANRYDTLLANMPIVIPKIHSKAYSSFHLYVIRLKLREIKNTHKDVYGRLRSAGILVNLHYIPVYRQPYYERFDYLDSDFKNAEQYYSEVISIPIYSGLSMKDQDRVVESLRMAIDIQ